ncbi:MAG: hypothetical protein LQ348_003145 [Seirophora lacunosa]|nr:MAG: hypothetical protein LQ344_007274 [Seirophora lacunosa]KAI4192482.1 MAG: hypothetical protein LQ348_003145 [Seirophora lacunosa]
MLLLPCLAFLLLPLFHHTTAIPLGPAGRFSVSSLLPGGPATTADGNLTPFYRNLPLLRDAPLLNATSGKRPRTSKIYPELGAGHYHLRFHDYGKDIEFQYGADVLAKASQEVDEWITVARKHSYTPVEAEHFWRSGPVTLTLSPAKGGYILADLKYFIALINAFHGNYGVFWEWDGEMFGTGGGSGAFTLMGRAKLKSL